MRNGFTLIEILVVITMLSILMMLIAPSGAKMVESVDNFITKKNEEKAVEKLQFQAFLRAKEINATSQKILQKFNIEYITAKGLMVKKGNDFE